MDARPRRPRRCGPDEPQSWNRYAYAPGNPLTNTGPTGLIAAVPQGCVGMPTADPSTGDYYMCPDDGGFPGRQQLWVDPDDGGGGGGGGVESYDPGPHVIGRAPPTKSLRQRQAGNYERAMLLRANIPYCLSLLAASKSPLRAPNERRRAAACLLGEVIRLHSTTAKP